MLSPLENDGLSIKDERVVSVNICYDIGNMQKLNKQFENLVKERQTSKVIIKKGIKRFKRTNPDEKFSNKVQEDKINEIEKKMCEN